jgi:glutamate-5-semialdehyde dehydrogenase
VTLVAKMNAMGQIAREAARVLRQSPAEQRNLALLAMAAKLRRRASDIVDENAADLECAITTEAMRDRLAVTVKSIDVVAKGLEEIAAFPDPVGRELARWTRPNGLDIARVATPIGVIALIYESRPNVTADAGALCLKSGNAAILRGGSEAWRSNAAIHAALVDGLVEAGLPPAAIQLVDTADRDAVGMLLAGLDGTIDLVVPRGGKDLVARVKREARVPVLAHLEGICHLYIHEKADLEKAVAIALNSKLRRTGVCGAAETLLIDRSVLRSVGEAALCALHAAGCEVRGDDAVRSILPSAKPAREDDWHTEYLDRIIAAKAVDGVEEAIRHIETYGSHHTESIVTEDEAAAEKFLSALDSAIVIWNASTQFADGGEFGMGAEIGIATGKLHARGPVGVEQLTTFKYVVRGTGQVRP